MSAIFGFDACSDRLSALLGQAQQARAAKDLDQASAIADDLTAFTNDSRPTDPNDNAEADAIAKLDALAEQTADELTAFALAGAVGDVVDRSGEIAAIGATLGKQGSANQDEARRVRLVPVQELVTALTATVAQAKAVAATLDTSAPDEAAIVSAIAATLDQLQTLEAAAQRAVGSA